MIVKVVFIALLAVVASSCSQREVDAEIVQNRSGVFYLPNESDPFSGIAASYFPTGQQALLNEYAKGKLSGRQWSWFENGQMKTEQVFHTSGELESSGEWYENGLLKSKRMIDPDGIAHIQNWDQEGILRSQFNISGDRLVGRNVWDPDGDTYVELTIDEDTGDAVYSRHELVGDNWVTELKEYKAWRLFRYEWHYNDDTPYTQQEWATSPEEGYRLVSLEGRNSYLNVETDQLMSRKYEDGEVTEFVSDATWHLEESLPVAFFVDEDHFYIDTKGSSESYSLANGMTDGTQIFVSEEGETISVSGYKNNKFHGWSLLLSDGVVEDSPNCWMHDELVIVSYLGDQSCIAEFGAAPKRLSDLNIEERLGRL
ncbi:MAG: hypothetical protein HOM20_06260 [Porticoccaceae bacterium]|jgi:antitoxin component YwqK of YwqJK toxin-antitoxin module|nr:hypothetical protein [Porticoccaceae bacterium]